MRLLIILVFILNIFSFSTIAAVIKPSQMPLWQTIPLPLVGSHQGGVFSGRPNTLKQFAEALSEGIEILEMDLRPTKDGHVVVFHDRKLFGATLNCRGEVSSKTLKQLKKCRYTLSGERIAAFKEVLDLVNGQAIINAEFKEKESAIPAIDLVKNQNAYHWVYFQTKSSQEWYEHARAYDAQVALLYKPRRQEQLNWILSKRDPNLAVVEIDEPLINKSNIAAIHAVGALVSTNSWRFVPHREIAGPGCNVVWDLGVDIAISDAARGCLEQKRQRKQ